MTKKRELIVKRFCLPPEKERSLLVAFSTERSSSSKQTAAPSLSAEVSKSEGKESQLHRRNLAVLFITSNAGLDVLQIRHKEVEFVSLSELTRSRS